MKKAMSALLATTAFLCAASTASAALDVKTQSPQSVKATEATLKGKLTPLSALTSYYFDYGRTAAYGSQTLPVYVALPTGQQAVSVRLTGLTPGTLYHYRLVAGEGLSVLFGADESFATEATGSIDGSSGGDAGTGLTSTGDPLGGLTGSGAGADDSGTSTSAPPVLGESLGAGPASGAIRVRVPGGAGFVPLADNAPIPVGSTVDATRGTVNLLTAVGTAGNTQTAQFRGSVFQVRQPRSAGGLTEIVLRGGDFSACRSAAGRRARGAASAARSHTVRRLWGRDHNGRFRTRGSHAIATVRGTEWTVADRCDGTLTKVAEGAVSVKDRTLRKTVLVKAGHSYLARARKP